jgi:hypothetical protein
MVTIIRITRIIAVIRIIAVYRMIRFVGLTALWKVNDPSRSMCAYGKPL